MASSQRLRPRHPGLRAVLGKPAYRRLFAAHTISRWGDSFNTVALVVLVSRLTGKGLGVTGVVTAEILPVLLLAPAAGVLVGRLPRVRLMVAADLCHVDCTSVGAGERHFPLARACTHPIDCSPSAV